MKTRAAYTRRAIKVAADIIVDVAIAAILVMIAVILWRFV